MSVMDQMQQQFDRAAAAPLFNKAAELEKWGRMAMAHMRDVETRLGNVERLVGR